MEVVMNHKQKNLYVFITFCFLLILEHSAAFAQKSPQFRVNLQETILKNGLRVILVEDRSTPVFTLAITYDVGSRDEPKGRTGFAHLFEHMMFQGSANVGKAEHFAHVFNSGGNMNGTTSGDRTNYYNILPSNQLEMALFLEADRMRGLEITQENFDNQRNAVQEERRLNVDNAAYGVSDELLQSLIYDNFAYKHVAIGSMEDLNAATTEDAKEFFKTYYAPNNAVLTLVGDFETKDALARIRKHFENIPKQPKPPVVDMTEPPQNAERRMAREDPLARQTRVNIAYKAVPGNTDDFYPLQVLSYVLISGQSSRLYQKLMNENQVASGVTGYMDERRGTGAFYITTFPNSGKTSEETEKIIYEEIEKLKTSPAADWEIQKAKNGLCRAFINNVQTSMGLSTTIGIYAVYYNDPNLINTRLDKVNKVTAEDVRRVANKYLTQNNRTVFITTPKAPAKPAAASLTANSKEDAR